MSRTRTVVLSAVTVLALSGGLLAVGAVTGGSPAPAPSPSATVQAVTPLERAQQHLQDVPGDYAGWAGLAVAYVDKARATGDPSWYAKAEGAVQKSLALDTRRNFLGFAGQAILLNAQHDFRGAEAAARKGLAINDFNSTLYGALGDALTQLGRYDDAAAAVDRMNELQPGVPAFTRASYVLELRGDVAGAKAALQRAVDDAVGGDTSFSQYYLGELALHYGEGAAKALSHYEAGLVGAPADAVLLAGRAKAEAALGRTDDALADYRTAVAARPEPQTVLELGQLLESTGDAAGAQDQYDLVRAQLALYASSGVALDTESTLFEADHGTPAKALANAVAGWRTRPFVEMADAYAWALHVNGRDREALGWSQKAFVSGWKTAPALYHRGIIKSALGDRAGARADLTEALRLDPAFDVLAAAKARAALSTLG